MAAPGTWWTDVTPWTPPDYAPLPYSPSGAARLNHALFGALRDSTFDYHDGGYRQGLAAGAGTLAAIAAVLVVVFPLAYHLLGNRADETAFRCQCRLRQVNALRGACGRAKAHQPGRGGAHALFWVSWAGLLAGVVLSAIGFLRFSKQVTAAGSDVARIHDSLSSAQSLAINVSNAMEDLKTTTDLSAAAVDTCTGGQVDMAAADGALNAAAIAAASVAANADLQEAIAKSDDWSRQMRATAGLRIAGIVVLVVLCAVFLASFAVLTRRAIAKGFQHPRKGCSRHFVRVLVLLALLLELGGWVAAAAFILLAMLSGDFCQAPDASARTLPPDNALKNYYLTCGGAETNAVAQSLQAAQQLVLTLMTDIFDAFTKAAEAQPKCAAVANNEIDGISNAAYDINADIARALDLTSCKNVNSIYVASIHGTMCRGGNRALALIVPGSILLLTGLLLVVMLWRLIETQAHADVQLRPPAHQSKLHVETHQTSLRCGGATAPAPPPARPAAAPPAVAAVGAQPAGAVNQAGPLRRRSTANKPGFPVYDFDSVDVSKSRRGSSKRPSDSGGAR
ncbi:hypothetical protein JKP88DRAFT_272593 [Tribonema minus]|uniref:Protein tweety homolog n=1 Tax=Tribonema minus TaxID=303371 RepID=A0A835Z2F6_9STRA|nr:hypothetical protein JKP88DRAFT_272593 [Tribonema minus]